MRLEVVRARCGSGLFCNRFFCNRLGLVKAGGRRWLLTRAFVVSNGTLQGRYDRTGEGREKKNTFILLNVNTVAG